MRDTKQRHAGGTGVAGEGACAPVKGESPTSDNPKKTGEYERQLRDMNAELVVSSVRQHELTEQAQRAESLIQCQKDSLEMVVKGEPIEAVLDFLARSMESLSQGRFLAAIHLMEADGYHFGYVAAPSLPPRYAEATRGMDARLELGTCSSAIMSHKPTVVRDFAVETRWPAFTAEVVSLGLRGCFTTPIVPLNQKTLGTFAIYYREPGNPSPRDQQLVDLVTSTVALAVERKRAEEALRESESRLRIMADAIPQLAWMAEPDGFIFWYNSKWYAYTGTTPEQMEGWGWQSVHDPDILPDVLKRWRRSIETGEAFEMEFPLLGADGVFRWFLTRVNPLRDSDGNIVRWFGTNTDITDRKQAEDVLLRYREELEDTVKIRTGQLFAANRGLQAENKERRLLEAERLRLLAAITTVQEDERRRMALDLHDHFGQQLTALRFRIELLGNKSEADEEFSLLVAETKSLVRQIDEDVDTLSFDLRPPSLDDIGLASTLADYVNEWSRRFEIPVRFQSARFGKKRLPPDIETHIYRITQEILTNICKHARASSVDVSFEKRSGFVILHATDDGVGFTLKKRKSGKPGTNGIGLIGMRERAAIVGGTLTIESVRGKGTSISVRVPIPNGQKANK